MRRSFITFLAIAGLIASGWAAKKEPKSSNYTNAKIFYENGKYDRAAELFQKEDSLNPDNGYVLSLLASCLSNLDRDEEALNTINRAIALLPSRDKSAISRAYIGRYYINRGLGRTANARIDLDSAMSFDKKNPMAWLCRANEEFRRGEIRQAKKDLEYMMTEIGANCVVFTLMADICIMEENYTQALEWIRMALRSNNQYPPAYVSRANAYRALQKWPEASNDIVNAIALLDKGSIDLSLVKKMTPEAADLLLTKLVYQNRQHPDQPRWVEHIAQVYKLRGMYPQALNLYERIFEADSTAKSALAVAKCQLVARNYQKALEFADKAFEIDSTYTAALETRATALMVLQRDDEAAEALTRALQIKPDNASLLTLRGICYSHNRRNDEAIRDLTVAMILKPSRNWDPQIYYRLGDAYAFSNQPEPAAHWYEKALEQAREDDDDVGGYEAFALAGLGRADEAIEAMQEQIDKYQAMEADPAEATANGLTKAEVHERALGMRFNMVCLLARLNQTDEAMDALEALIADGYDQYLYVRYDRDLDALRSLPRYQALIATLPE